MKHFPQMMLRSAEMGEWHDLLSLSKCYTIMINSKPESAPKTVNGTGVDLGLYLLLEQWRYVKTI